MNKKKVRGFCIFILIISLCFPLILVNILDSRDLNKEISFEDNQTEEILKKHPVIENIYKLYPNYTDKIEEYVIRRIGEYDQEKQEKLTQYQSLFSKEIQKIIDHKVISHELLENFDKKHYVDYGTIYISDISYDLNQILRMWEYSYKSFQYQMEPHTKKIINLTISQEKAIHLSDDEIKTISWGMIEYLELDDIDDWSYNQYGYESNKAKLRISCELERRVGTNTITVGVTLLGVLNPNVYRTINKS